MHLRKWIKLPKIQLYSNGFRLSSIVCNQQRGRKGLISCPTFSKVQMDRFYESYSVPLRHVLFIYFFFASTMFLLRRSDPQTCAHTDLLRSPPHVMWTLWVSLCGAPNQITSHVEEMNLRRAEREQRVICKRASRCMCARLHRDERGDGRLLFFLI